MVVNVLTYLVGLRPAIPYNRGDRAVVSNSELRRWIKNGSILFNGETVTWDEPVDFPVFSLVFFPTSKHRTTLV